MVGPIHFRVNRDFAIAMTGPALKKFVVLHPS